MQGLERLFAEVSKAAIKDLKLSFSEQRPARVKRVVA
jgi:hypothetical protein